MNISITIDAYFLNSLPLIIVDPVVI